MMPSTDRDALPPEANHWTVLRLPSLQLLRLRLQEVFPEGLDGRAWATA